MNQSTALAIDAAPPTVADVLDGLLHEEFTLNYQPQVDAMDGRLVGFEALARWHSPRFGQVSPLLFVNLLEQAGHIHDLWDGILTCASSDLPALTTGFGNPLHVALNLSPQQLQDPELSSRFGHWLARRQIDGSQIHIEITESTLLNSNSTMLDNLDRFTRDGIALWLDDFGTGYSGLRHLRELPVAGLKIDKSFVDRLESALDDFRIVSAITAMACSLGLKIVAEGVETEAQMQMLSQLGCTTLQGYLIGRPAPLDSLQQTWASRPIN